MAEFARWLTIVIFLLSAAVFSLELSCGASRLPTCSWRRSDWPYQRYPRACRQSLRSRSQSASNAWRGVTPLFAAFPQSKRWGGNDHLFGQDGHPDAQRADCTHRRHRNSIYETFGSGYDPHGGFTKDGQDAPIDSAPDLAEILRAVALCNDAALHEKNGVWSIDGDPTEGALLTAAVKGGVDLRLQSHELHDHLGNGYIFVKGAPERLLDICFWQRDSGEEQRPLDSSRWLARIDEVAAKGQRVLGVASKRTVADHCELTFGDVETGLTFLGLIGLIDPPREETLDAIRQCAGAGSGVKMITDDHAATAAAVGRELGLRNSEAVLTGRDLDALQMKN